VEVKSLILNILSNSIINKSNSTDLPLRHKGSLNIYIFKQKLTVALLFMILGCIASPLSAKTITPPAAPPHTDHSTFFKQKLADGPAVTRACLECHPKSATDIMHTAHWRWEGKEVEMPGRGKKLRIGKKNVINNFCIGVQGNWPRCTICHIGYGWEDDSFDFDQQEAVDCLVCHDKSGGYAKGLSGHPAEGVDLLAAAKSVGRPGRANCGSCHFSGGGGNAVKHGDLDRSMLNPNERIDIHMGLHKFECVDCHQTTDHNIPGKAISVSVDDNNRVLCVDCHLGVVHEDKRLDSHIDAIACQTCHIPFMAVDEATKMTWDWSTAGDKDLENALHDKHKYMAIKGSFNYLENLQPEYAWYDGESNHYLLGDIIDPNETTVIAGPRGNIESRKAKIWPFKLHSGNQIYDSGFNRFIVPKTFGPGGYWTEFDWDKAARLGAKDTGLEYSGSYGFAPTVMFWPLSHMVSGSANALQCTDCHKENSRLNWEELGYPGDPVDFGGRRSLGLIRRDK
jgi:octaheme c-type cytochrome (tetrathionate reductase family)